MDAPVIVALVVVVVVVAAVVAVVLLRRRRAGTVLSVPGDATAGAPDEGRGGR